MPRVLEDNEIVTISELGQNNIKFRYVGVGICDHCSKADLLFQASKDIVYSNSDIQLSTVSEQNRCGSCLHSHYTTILHGAYFNLLDETNGALVQVAEHDIKRVARAKRDEVVNAGLVKFCASCYMPEVQTDSGQYIINKTALDCNGEVVEVHSRCGDYSGQCVTCESIYLTDRSEYQRHRFYAFTYLMNKSVGLSSVNDELYCEQCYEVLCDTNDVGTCRQCDEQYTDNNLRGFNGDDYCRSCFDNCIYTCNNCGEDYHEDDGHYDCEEDDESNSSIHNYSYKPVPEFFGNGNFHMGFELEVECVNTSKYDSAEAVESKLGAHAYMKEDGSLDDGYEIVTHPHTLESYNTNFNWEFLTYLKRNGVRSWNTRTCGLHVHVSRAAFDPVRNPNTRAERVLLRQAHELRFMKLIYDNQRQVERLAGRSSHYSSFDDKGNLIRKVKNGHQNNGRYSAINTENSATLEVRVFRGSLRPERVRSALEFVHAAVEYTRDLKVTGKNNALSWSKFIVYVVTNEDKYPNLLTIINESFAGDTPTDN